MATITNLPDEIHDDAPWPEAPETTRTPRQVWCQAVQQIADRAKQTLPACAGRVDAAVKLVLQGDVELLPDGHARVQSQSNGETIYRLVNGTCNCRDYEHAPNHWCKHKIAAGLMKRAGLPPIGAVHEDLPAAEHHETVQGIDPRWVQMIHGKPHVRYMGLLAMAHERGLKGISAKFISVTLEMALAEATVEFQDGAVYSEAADSTPTNVPAGIKAHWARLALTRAKARCLRDALNIGVAAVEELD